MPEVRQRNLSSLMEPLAAWAAAIVIASGLFWLGRAVDFVQRIMQGVIACTFLIGPHLAVRISGSDPLYRLQVFGTGRTICPEPFVAIDLAPGKSHSWTIRYNFTDGGA